MHRVKEKQTGIISKMNTESFRHTAVVRNTRKTKVLRGRGGRGGRERGERGGREGRFVRIM